MPWLVPAFGAANSRTREPDAAESAVINQRPFLLTVGFVLVLVAVVLPQLYGNPLFLAGIVVTVLTRIPGAVPSLRYRTALLNWLTPLMQFGAVALLRAGGSDSLTGLSLVAVFPVIWVSWIYHGTRRVHLLNLAATLVIVWGPIILAGATLSATSILGLLLVPAILCVVGVFTASVSHSIHTQQWELRDKDRKLRSVAAERERHAQLLDTVIETVPTGVVVVDGDGNDVLMNSHQRQLHHVASPGDLDDPREDQLLLFAADKTTALPADERPVRRAIAGEEVVNQLMWIGERHLRAMSVSARPIQDPDGTYAGSVIVFNDVTDLMEALDAKDAFLHRVSHELRTPLTSILGYLDLALEELEQVDRVGQERADHDLHQLAANLQVVERNAERLLLRVSDLLESASRPSVRLQSGDLTDVVRSSLESARPYAESAGVILVDSTVSGLAGEFDPARMHQVFDNLIVNAIKYSSSGDTVTTSCRSDGGCLEVCVSDTGRGMTEADRLRVFEQFFRTPEVKESTIPGLGLGLTIASAIVQAHEGVIEVESSLGVGTSFTVRVPGTAGAGPGRPARR
ncbi:PAS domain-containing sensor histidine kinase [Corynebacterium sp. USCH3]|uniref:sensor histidine kinase n=1 Tax=Corynebacterium sp. USCH3 TaxID=3024840 RepID=UPI00309768C3